jgi:cytochrome c peroxidase
VRQLTHETAPLGRLVARSKGGYYHDGRFPTLRSVVEHYDSCLNLELTGGEKGDLVQYLRSR